MKLHLMISGALALAVGFTPVPSEGADWSRFRGSNGSGTVPGARLPSTFDGGKPLWTAGLPGSGNSSPVTGGGNLYVTSADAQKEKRYLTAISTESGKRQWVNEYPLTPFSSNKRNGFASSTPCTDKDHVYVLWQGEDASSIHAVNHQGKEVWKYALGIFAAKPGCATSPIVYQDKVFLTHDNEQHDSFLLALDAKTGNVIWKTVRVAQRTGFSTPVIYEGHSDIKQVIFSHSYEGMVGLDIQTGEIIWQNRVFGDHQQRAIGSPVIAGNQVIAASGFTAGIKTLVSLKPDLVNKQHEAEESFRVTRNVPHVPTPIVVEDLLFLWTDKGILACVDIKSGEEVWAERIGGEFFASPICVGNVIYGVDRDGVVTAVEVARKFKLLGKSELQADSFSTPAFADGRIFFRTTTGIIAFGKK